jgi:hypothetical protein
VEQPLESSTTSPFSSPDGGQEHTKEDIPFLRLSTSPYTAAGVAADDLATVEERVGLEMHSGIEVS